MMMASGFLLSAHEFILVAVITVLMGFQAAHGRTALQSNGGQDQYICGDKNHS